MRLMSIPVIGILLALIVYLMPSEVEKPVEILAEVKSDTPLTVGEVDIEPSRQSDGEVASPLHELKEEGSLEAPSFERTEDAVPSIPVTPRNPEFERLGRYRLDEVERLFERDIVPPDVEERRRLVNEAFFSNERFSNFSIHEVNCRLHSCRADVSLS